MTCKACAWEKDHPDSTLRGLTHVDAATTVGCSEKSIRRHRKGERCSAVPDPDAGQPTLSVAVGQDDSESHNGTTGESSYSRFSDRPWGYSDYIDFLREKGVDPETVTFDWGYTSKPGGGFWNKLNRVRPIAATGSAKGGGSDGPAWPVIQPATPVSIAITAPASCESHEVRRKTGMKLSLKCADTQIGFRRIDSGLADSEGFPPEPFEAFHDDRAMAVFLEVCRREQPDSIVILGDFLDLPSQSRWAQEAGFAQTTQMALDYAHHWLASLRAACDTAEIVLVEGNHDKRMQSYVETNALAAFGLRQAGGVPGDWPVMSLPHLLRLDSIRVQYVDAYPAATYWDNEGTRNIHGTRANGRGSTTAQYSHELPTVSTWSGHAHRTEITYRSVLGPGGKAISTYSANPGALCKTDGTVPSVHGAIHSNGTSARVVEDWQQGFGSLLYTPNGVETGIPDFPQVHRIHNGATLYNGSLIQAQS